ncbi:MAG: hypothetical protein OXE99_12280 [Cellvibrionales bacterium]|nr:hypothetical protein [Cellvibrionales bacterium]
MPSLFAGFFGDDYNFYALIFNPNNRHILTDNASLHDLFTFLTSDRQRTQTLIDYGLIPWWIDKDMKAVFFRPLSEVTHLFDFYVLKQPWLMHLHSLCWYALLLYAVYKLYATFSHLRPVVMLGLLFFAVDATHAFTVAWIANRNAIMASAFIVFALIYHHYYRESRQTHHQLLSLLFILLGLLSGEIALSIAPILFAYACFYENHGQITWMDSAKSLAAPALLLLAWLIFYKTAGFGARSDGGYYLDAIGQPLQFIHILIERLPAAINMQFQPVPAFHFPGLETFNQLSGWVMLITLVAGSWIMKNRLYNFCLVANVLSLVPVLSVEAQERNFMVAGIFTSLMLATVLYRLVIQLRFRLTLRAIAYIIGFGHLLASFLLTPIYAYAPRLLDNPGKFRALSLPKDLSQYHAVFTLGNSVFDASKMNGVRYYFHHTPFTPIINLTALSQEVSIEFNENKLMLKSEQGLLSTLDLLFRNTQKKPFALNQHFLVGRGCKLQINELTAKKIPSTLTLTCEKALTHYGFFITNKTGEFIPLKKH